MKRIIEIPDYVVKAIQNGEDYRYDIHTAIAQSTPYNPSGDCISRSDLKKAIEEVEDNYDGYEPNDLGKFMNKVYDLIDNAPTVQAFTLEDMQNNFDAGVDSVIGKYDKAEGEWINHRNDYGHNIADCSLCGKAMQWHDEDEDGIPRYCWYCGAKMKGGAENDCI